MLFSSLSADRKQCKHDLFRLIAVPVLVCTPVRLNMSPKDDVIASKAWLHFFLSFESSRCVIITHSELLTRVFGPRIENFSF